MPPRSLIPLIALLLPLAPLGAQTAVKRLTTMVGADAAARILDRVERARAGGLPAAALEQRALELAAKGVSPVAIEAAVRADETALASARHALVEGREAEPKAAEIEGAAAAIRRGVSQGAIAAIAAVAGRERPIAVSLFVVSSLLDGGACAEDAVRLVASRLATGATDRDLVALVQRPGVSALPRTSQRAPADGAVPARPRPVSGPPRGDPRAGRNAP